MPHYIGYISRDDADYAFLIPIYQDADKLEYFHQWRKMDGAITGFAPHRKQDYETCDGVEFRAALDAKRFPEKNAGDHPILVFKTLDQVKAGTIADADFRAFLEDVCGDSRMTNDYLKKEIKTVLSLPIVQP